MWLSKAGFLEEGHFGQLWGCVCGGGSWKRGEKELDRVKECVCQAICGWRAVSECQPIQTLLERMAKNHNKLMGLSAFCFSLNILGLLSINL